MVALLGRVMDEGSGKGEDRLGKVESDVSSIKVDIAVLKTDVSYIKGDVADVRRDVAEFRGDVKRDGSELRNRQERDFRILFGSLIFVALSMAGLMAKAFGWIH